MRVRECVTHSSRVRVCDLTRLLPRAALVHYNLREEVVRYIITINKKIITNITAGELEYNQL